MLSGFSCKVFCSARPALWCLLCAGACTYWFEEPKGAGNDVRQSSVMLGRRKPATLRRPAWLLDCADPELFDPLQLVQVVDKLHSPLPTVIPMHC